MAKEGPPVHPLIPLVEQSVSAWIEEKDLKLKRRAIELFRTIVAYDAMQNIHMTELDAATALNLDQGIDDVIDELRQIEPRLLILVALPSQRAVNLLKERGQFRDPHLAPPQESTTLGHIAGHNFREDRGSWFGDHPADED